MTQMERPLSPHLQVYRWQVQMVTSILHRATGVALSVGTLLVICGLFALAAGEAGFANFRAFLAHPVGQVLLLGWSWSLFYHLCNGIRHLLQDAGMGFRIEQFVRSSWLAAIGSIVLTALVWACVLVRGGAA
ncbi:succinate dehydrogenase subunit C [Mizugakiibacter sediminis]|uniref:Succinate dehydrogenase cytochrome b556 subunit n=1 Tax=Mizugakiibacter sediminis TaxID=1475481 RepID=A0A0K8QQX3_9GAMM|nr:succinate dehydrogenase, cytochrome b556 subunit [Mizugakiibacter sediminis]GAP67313.1 succinate dehydrogenase subunit C [Mizugakiibacter sediminis]